MGVRARSRCDDPGRIRAPQALPWSCARSWSSKRKIAAYLRRTQGAHGGWPLFHDGDFDISASVKAYFALKMIGDPRRRAAHARARKAIWAHGGAGRSNVFTRALLALYGMVSWRAVPAMPVEIMLLPSWFPFHLDKVSYWARTVLTPLLVLRALQPRARNPKGVTIEELFLEPPQQLGTPPKAPHQKWFWFVFFRIVDAVVRRDRTVVSERASQARDRRGGRVRHHAAQRRGRPWRDLPGDGQHGDDVRHARLSGRSSRRGDRAPIDREIARSSSRTRPIASHACRRSGTPRSYVTHCWSAGSDAATKQAVRGPRMARPTPGFDIAGDWSVQRPNVRPGGWAFQYANAYYPDLDDTAVVVMAMDRVRTCSGQINSTQRSLAPASGSADYRAATAAGLRSMLTMCTTISTTSRFRTMAHSSTRRPRT